MNSTGATQTSMVQSVSVLTIVYLISIMNELILNPVFIDTSVFHQYKFNFSSKQFQQLTELSNENLIKIIMTEITKREIINNIEELSRSAEDGFSNLIRKNAFVKYNLKNDFSSIAELFDKKTIFKNCSNNFELWLKEAKVEILPMSYSDPSEIFDLYFQKKPPFQYKKSEFPDAFNLSIICTGYENITIVSKDRDLLEYKNSRISNTFNSLNEFIDFILQQEHSIHSLIIKAYNDHKSYITRQIKEGFSTFKIISYRGNFSEAPKVKDLIVNEENIVEIKNNTATINLNIYVPYEVLVFYEKNNDYTLEKDTHWMDIEVTFSYIVNTEQNNLDNVKIESIKPRTAEDSIVLLNEEEFGL